MSVYLDLTHNGHASTYFLPRRLFALQAAEASTLMTSFNLFKLRRGMRRSSPLSPNTVKSSSGSGTCRQVLVAWELVIQYFYFE